MRPRCIRCLVFKNIFHKRALLLLIAGIRHAASGVPSTIVIVHSKRNKPLSFCEVACIRRALEGAYYRGDHFDLLEKRIFLFSIFLLFYFSIWDSFLKRFTKHSA